MSNLATLLALSPNCCPVPSQQTTIFRPKDAPVGVWPAVDRRRYAWMGAGAPHFKPGARKAVRYGPGDRAVYCLTGDGGFRIQDAAGVVGGWTPRLGGIFQIWLAGRVAAPIGAHFHLLGLDLPFPLRMTDGLDVRTAQDAGTSAGGDQSNVRALQIVRMP